MNSLNCDGSTAQILLTRHAVGAVTCVGVEYCPADGIHALKGVINACSLSRVPDMGWQSFGLHQHLGREWVLAALMPIDASEPEAIRVFYGIEKTSSCTKKHRPSITGEISS